VQVTWVQGTWVTVHGKDGEGAQRPARQLQRLTGQRQGSLAALGLYRDFVPVRLSQDGRGCRPGSIHANAPTHGPHGCHRRLHVQHLKSETDPGSRSRTERIELQYNVPEAAGVVDRSATVLFLNDMKA
jgi:hypothetical protein